MSISYRVPMIFPGQASQVVGMARDLAEAGGAAAAFLATVDAELGDNLTGIMFEGPGETLTEPHNAQPAVSTCPPAPRPSAYCFCDRFKCA